MQNAYAVKPGNKLGEVQVFAISFKIRLEWDSNHCLPKIGTVWILCD